jgi:hypothetical protein
MTVVRRLVLSPDSLQVTARVRVRIASLLIFAGVFGCAVRARAQQEPPYFVTYSSVMEEPGNLEIENQNIVASPKNANAFFAPTVEFEYGVTAWWTAEAYIQGQTTKNDSTVFTGFRFESRLRPVPREYWINPVLYVEYEDVNAADKSFLEITGNTSIATLQVSNAALRNEVERSIETKLILSSNAKGWNFSENFIAEKAVNETEPSGALEFPTKSSSFVTGSGGRNEEPNLSDCYVGVAPPGVPGRSQRLMAQESAAG